ncbi:F-box/kelch-repeat protein At3g23880-like [Malus sylvestris]|uniref:F-box/kelch-repeat protein At3g23880-like n=1 Tax=Malus sylvestris TaxID=3752 RepID=UPI0021ACD2CA|nr:F-box/kelch-repeat protein At3g23880-like [Malus sylvestris]
MGTLLDHSNMHNEHDDQRQLPYEIAEEILLQLPVKSLLRFRSVCKPWLALISDPKFVKSHLLIRSTKQDDDDDDRDHDHDAHGKTTSSKARLMLSSLSLLQSVHIQVLNTTTIDAPATATLPSRGDGEAESLAEAKAETEAKAEAAGTTGANSTTRVVEAEHEYSVIMRRPVKDMKIVGSCNGLVCLVVDSEDMMIYNPSTRQVHAAPKLPTISGKDYFYGFGYDSRKEDYKIVRVTSSSKAGVFATQLDIYSLKTNTWRARSETLPFYLLFNLVGTLLNGALHWAVRRGKTTDQASANGDDERPFSIVSFDIAEETYRQVPLPGDGDKNFSFYGLGVLGGRLSMLHSPHGSDYQVWLMNEYGVKASWSIFTTIPRKMDSEYLGLMSLLSILKNGEILILLHQRKLVIYNQADRNFRAVFAGDVHSSQVVLYMESLAPPTARGGEPISVPSPAGSPPCPSPTSNLKPQF